MFQGLRGLRHQRAALRSVDRALSRLQRGPGRAGGPDTEPVRARVRELITTALAGVDPDTALYAEIDGLIDTYAVEWRRPMLVDHHDQLLRLDRLAVTVEGVIARLEHLAHDREHRLAESGGVVTHTWDRLVEPDVPHFDPLRREEPT